MWDGCKSGVLSQPSSPIQNLCCISWVHGVYKLITCKQFWLNISDESWKQSPLCHGSFLQKWKISSDGYLLKTQKIGLVQKVLRKSKNTNSSRLDWIYIKNKFKVYHVSSRMPISTGTAKRHTRGLQKQLDTINFLWFCVV